MNEIRCKYVQDRGYVLPSHLRACVDRACKGCEPCERDAEGRPVKHCTARRSCSGHVGHGEITCPRCIGRTREDLWAIVDHSTAMLDEAIEKGVDSEAAYLAGPTTDPAKWSTRKAQVKAWLAETLDDEAYLRALNAMPEDDPDHPYLVLGRLDMAIREDYAHPSDERVTVTNAAAYLDRQLDRIAQDPEQDWPQIASEIAACRAHLEAVLHDSRKPEQGARCPECGNARLVKRYRHEVDGSADTWRCPDCGEEWGEADYRLRVGTDYRKQADRLTAPDLAERMDLSAGTIRRWASKRRHVLPDETVLWLPPLLWSCGRDAMGRKLYRVDAAEALARGWCDFPKRRGAVDEEDAA